jgi:two-component system, cell cycle response regulator DivK
MTKASENMTAIIIDDEPDNLNVAAMILQHYGVRVQTAMSADEGLALLKKEKPTFALIDILMAKKSGYEMLKEIRSDPSLNDIAVIALTAYAMEGDRQKGLQAGFDGYITKPIFAKTIFDDIKAMLAAKV